MNVCFLMYARDHSLLIFLFKPPFIGDFPASHVWWNQRVWIFNGQNTPVSRCPKLSSCPVAQVTEHGCPVACIAEAREVASLAVCEEPLAHIITHPWEGSGSMGWLKKTSIFPWNMFFFCIFSLKPINWLEGSGGFSVINWLEWLVENYMAVNENGLYSKHVHTPNILMGKHILIFR